MAVNLNTFGTLEVENPFHQAEFFRALSYQLEQEIKGAMNKLRKNDESTYEVHIRFDRDYNVLNPKFYWVVQISKKKYKPYAWDDETVGKFVFTLVSKNAYTHDAKLKDLVKEFSELLDNIAEKELLAEELYEKHNLHINEDMEGINIEVRITNDEIQYMLTKTPEYEKIAKEAQKSHRYHVACTNNKDDIVSLLVGDWVTLKEIDVILSLTNE